jgi:hypothetical protein
MRPICVACQRFYRAKKNGFYFIEGMPRAGAPRNPTPGTSEPEHWEPYKLWVGDLYECEGCGHQIVSGFGRGPIAEHYQQDFLERVVRVGAELQVNDC